MTKAHIYYSPRKGWTYIDGIRVPVVRFNDSIQRSQRVQDQARSIKGRFIKEPLAEKPEKRPEEILFPEPPIIQWIIHGIARPKAKTDARTPDLVSDHFVASSERIGNIDAQEQKLNAKYQDWVHFDTYIEEIE